MTECCIPVLKYPDFGGFDQRLSIEVHVEPATGDQKINVIRRGKFRSLLDEVRQRYDRHNPSASEDSFPGCAVNGLRIGMQVVVKEQDVALQPPVDLLRAADLVGEPELGRVTLSGRAMPRTSLPGNSGSGCAP